MRVKIKCQNVAHLRTLYDILKRLLSNDTFELIVNSPVATRRGRFIDFHGEKMKRFYSLDNFLSYAAEVFAEVGRERLVVDVYCELSSDEVDIVQNRGNYVVSLDAL